MQTSRTFQLSLAALVAAVGIIATPSPVQAIEQFPGALQEAAGLACAPSCTVCHTTNPGTANTWGKPLGAAMRVRGATKDKAEAGIKEAYAKLVADANGGDATAKDLIDKLQAGIAPDSGAELCQITYGCGARIAKDEPRDDWSALLFVAGAMGFGAFLRRTRRR
ncbi:MAG: hypothetical protein K0R38_1885 [Polyangiaceae bacterium]|jgi:hypothetical protein|nr:hypothetical protein [Polyangiaceae bacterium]